MKNKIYNQKRKSNLEGILFSILRKFVWVGPIVQVLLFEKSEIWSIIELI